MAAGRKTGGRTKGTPNKIGRSVKQTIAEVFDELQDDPKTSLKTWAQRNPDDFYKVVAPKIIPTQIEGGLDIETKVTKVIKLPGGGEIPI